MPNWRKPEDYKFPPKFPDYRWAWEFLRRNPQYRSEWDAALLRFQSKTGEFAGPYGMSEFAKTGKMASLRDKWGEDPDHPGFFLPVDEARKWHLPGGMLNPATDHPDRLTFDVDFGAVTFMHEGESFRSRGHYYPIVEFNLHLPLTPQIEAVSKNLRAALKGTKIKPRRSKQHRRKWPRYLRLLDADLDGRTPKQIADVFGYEGDALPENRVWEQVQAAKQMTTPERYISIFVSSEKKGRGLFG